MEFFSPPPLPFFIRFLFAWHRARCTGCAHCECGCWEMWMCMCVCMWMQRREESSGVPRAIDCSFLHRMQSAWAKSASKLLAGQEGRAAMRMEREREREREGGWRSRLLRTSRLLRSTHTWTLRSVWYEWHVHTWSRSHLLGTWGETRS